MSLKAIIIDDEQNARELLQVILQDYCADVEVVAMAADLPSGVKLIREHQPDLVFLDIEMPEYSGLQLFDFLKEDEADFQLIFATAYAEYALKAFELSAVDYLLKPLRPNQVQQAVEKAISAKERASVSERFRALQENLRSNVLKRIGLPVSDGVSFYPLEKLMFFQADGMYCKVFIDGEEPQLISKPIKHFADLLAGHPSFFRPHRSYFINLNFMKQYLRTDGGYILMDNGEQVPIARERKNDFQEILNNWTV
ncbi:MAG: response regulator transcription factor [Flavobacteriales bacterium]|nr:response regulator transcription factor [Flavobacteriales bacterium]MCB9190372.1 response regulator transcription factor [Flavobacteriales bacterium]MCB9204620.1 response regulator transcription factor [Flavobacteriales bacterium]